MTFEHESSAPAAGWYPDPAGTHQLRWWSGTGWSNQLQPYPPGHVTAAVNPAGQQYGATHPVTDGGHSAGTPYTMRSSGQRSVPKHVPMGTWAFWLIVLAPIARIVALALWDMEPYIRKALSTDPEVIASAVTDPGYMTVATVGLIVYAATIIAAFIDRRMLIARGVERPFHWAWTILAGIIYVIGRSVVVYRRSGRGLAPLWTFVALAVTFFIVAIVKASLMSELFTMLVTSDIGATLT